MGSLESDITPHAREALDLFGESITIQNQAYLGDDPDEGTAQWDTPTETTVQGRILENQRPMESTDGSTQRMTGEYHIFVASDVDIRDGLQSDETRASRVIDSDGDSYDILRVTDEHNGLIRCQASMEEP